VSYQITGATTRSGNDNDASGNFAIGTSTITWTITDGCQISNCTTTIIINDLTDPTFAPIGPFCLGVPPPILPTTSENGLTGSWNPSTINTSTVGTIPY